MPAMVIDPERGEGSVFGATEYVILPSPVPLPPAVTVIHGELDVAAHVQLAPVTTEIAPIVVPPDGHDALVVDKL